MKREFVKFKRKLWLVTDFECGFDEGEEDEWATWELTPYGWASEKEYIGLDVMTREVKFV